MNLKKRREPCKCGADLYWVHPYPKGSGDPPRNADGTPHTCRFRIKDDGATRTQYISALISRGITAIDGTPITSCNITQLAKAYAKSLEQHGEQAQEDIIKEDEPKGESESRETPPPPPPPTVHEHHYLEEELIELIKSGHTVWLCGDMGSGKTYTVEQIGKRLEYKVYRIPCGPQTVKSEIFGYTNAANGEYVPGILWMALANARQGNKALVIWDEADCINPGVAKNVHGCWDGSVVTFPNGETLCVRETIAQVVCANTWGRPTPQFPVANNMDAAMMTRFTKMHWTYDSDFERYLYRDILSWVDIGQRIRQACGMHGVKTIAVTMRTFDAMRKFSQAGKSREYALLRTVWTGASKDDANKIASSVGLTIPQEAHAQWQN